MSYTFIFRYSVNTKKIHRTGKSSTIQKVSQIQHPSTLLSDYADGVDDKAVSGMCNWAYGATGCEESGNRSDSGNRMREEVYKDDEVCCGGSMGALKKNYCELM